MTENNSLETLLRHDKWIVCAGLVSILLLAWSYLLTGAGMDMSPLDMITLSFLPYQDSGEMLTMPELYLVPGDWSLQHWIIVFLMWWIMMIAMMVPSAAPMILLYTRVVRYAGKNFPATRITPLILFFVSGYLFAWLMFSIFATTLQWFLDQNAWLSMQMFSNKGWLTAGLVILVGIYQLTPLKQACLKKCRSPAQFITDHMKSGGTGAMQMGIEHGIFCVGCCWSLMLLLIVGGVMNLLWIVFLTLVVLAEKLLPFGEKVSAITGYILVTWGIFIFFTM